MISMDSIHLLKHISIQRCVLMMSSNLVRILTECSDPSDPSDRIGGRCCVGLALPNGFISRRNVIRPNNRIKTRQRTFPDHQDTQKQCGNKIGQYNETLKFHEISIFLYKVSFWGKHEDFYEIYDYSATLSQMLVQTKVY